MLNYVNAASYQQSLGEGPRRSIIDLTFHTAATIAQEARYLARSGVLGMLPLANYATGDTLALRALPGQPLARWQVVRISHVGEGWRTIASQPSRVLATAMVLDRPLQDQQALRTSTEPILEFSRWLGDDENLTRSVIDQLRDDTQDQIRSAASVTPARRRSRGNNGAILRRVRPTECREHRSSRLLA